MKQLILATAIGFFAVAGFAGSALAGKDVTGKPGNGNQGCFSNMPHPGTWYKNPGAAFQALGMAPGQYAKAHDTTVGALIDGKCGFAPPEMLVVPD